MRSVGEEQAAKTSASFDYSNPPIGVQADQVLPWETQAHQYPSKGEPGIHYFRGELGAGRWVDCLLHYDEDGTLSGILNHFPQDIPPYEKKGAANVWVRPDRRRQGIATKLGEHALTRWELYGEDQNWTPETAAGAREYYARSQGVTPDGIRYDRQKPAKPPAQQS